MGPGCCEDHFRDGYSPSHRMLLEQVREFDSRLLAAIDGGYDVSAVAAALDPDPARYTWVDEGENATGTVLVAAEKLLGELVPIPGFRRGPSRILPTAAAAVRPSVAVAADGRTGIAWIEWAEGLGEQVMACLLGPDGAELASPVPVSPGFADCLRPSLIFDASGQPWVFFGSRSGGSVGVWYVTWSAAGWSEPSLVSGEISPSFNQEAVAHSDGSVECCWQGLVGGRFQVMARRFANGRWAEPEQVSGAFGRNVWDPAVAPSPGGGTAYAWTGYSESGYTTVVLVREPGRRERWHELGAPGGYSLHPSLALGPDGSLWCAYDAVSIAGHAGSGPTRLRPAGDLGRRLVTGTRGDGIAVPGELAPDIRATIRVAALTPGGREWREVPEIGDDRTVSPAGLPRLAVDSSGNVAVAFRAIRRLPLMRYFWDTVVEWLGAGGWTGPHTFEAADGPLEEPSCAPAGPGVIVAWQEDGRRGKAERWTEGFGGQECPALREHYGEVVWHSLHTGGRIRLGISEPDPRLPASTSAPLTVGDRGSTAQRAPAAAMMDARATVDARPWLRARKPDAPARYETVVSGRRHTLYWGDLHRHSLISRCTAGDEPSLEDMYRYAWDICEYDFWALTDHAENTSPYQWWSLQKMADVLHVPGIFVPLYGFEWTASTGHQNVIYDSLRRGAPIFSSTAAKSATPATLWQQLRRHPEYRSLTIPHHPGSAMVPFDWSYQDEGLMRLVEIFQACRGNYEADGCHRQYADGTLPGTFVVDGLRRGQKFGLIASSDHGNGASYVGAYATGLTRDAVFDALHARRTFAATTRDIIVDFRINDHFMGGVTEPCGHARISGYVRGYTDLARIDLIRDGVTIQTWEPPLELPAGWLAVPLRVEWKAGSLPDTDWTGNLSVVGGEVLLAGFWSPDIVSAGRNHIAWSAHTRNFRSQYGAQRGGVEVTVIGPRDAVIRVQTEPHQGAVQLGELAGRRGAQQIEIGSSGHGRLCLQSGTGALRSLGTREMPVLSETEVSGAHWYYLRVMLIDGEMAWSSPVWVTPSA